MAKLLTYEQKDTWMDRLCGVTKLIYFLAWSITSMLTYDTRVLAVMLVFSLILFKISKQSGNRSVLFLSSLCSFW